MSEQELIPCPWCKTAEHLYVDNDDGLVLWVACRKCGGHGPHESTSSEAFAKWQAQLARPWITHDAFVFLGSRGMPHHGLDHAGQLKYMMTLIQGLERKVDCLQADARDAERYRSVIIKGWRVFESYGTWFVCSGKFTATGDTMDEAIDAAMEQERDVDAT